jgi:acetyl esterase
MPLDPQTQPFVEAMLPMDQYTPAEVRASIAEYGAPPIQCEVAHVFDTTIPGPEGPLQARVYSEADPAVKSPALLFLHGSGFVLGGLDSHDNFCRQIASRARFKVVALDYRLAPEHKYPAATEDAYAAACWLAEHGDQLAIAGDELAIGGDSAGGNLAAVVSLMLRDRGGPPLRLQLLMYPVLGSPEDGQPSYLSNGEGYGLTPDMMRYFMRHYVRTPADYADPYVCPLRAKDLSGLPPAMVLTAEFDLLRDEGEEYGRRLLEAGVPCTVARYEGEPHGFMSWAGTVDRAAEAFDECVAALHSALLNEDSKESLAGS